MSTYTRPRHGVRPELLETAALVPIEQLAYFDGNARLHDLDTIRESLLTHGQYAAVEVNRRTTPWSIVNGNGTVEGAASLGWTHVAVTYLDADRREAVKINVVDNRSSDVARNDPALQAALLAELGGDFTGTGLTPADEAALLAELDTPLDFDVLEPPAVELTLPQPFDTDRIIDTAFDYWRGRSFPYPSTPPHEALQQVNKLARTPSPTLRNTNTAYGVPDAYHPHRFTTKIPGKWTPLEAFERDDKLRHALRMLAEADVAITPSSLRSMLGFVRNSQCAANFRPGFALLLLRMYAPPGGRWLDTSTGFGGRLVAFAASELGSYVGIDPSTLTDRGNRAMVDDLGIGDRVTLIAKPAEDVTVDEVGGAGSCDFAFTSPPYFGKEQYADEPTQSFMRYTTGDAWRDGFLLPTMRLQYEALAPGAVAVVNIADVKIGGNAYPLCDWTVDCATGVGFTLERTDQFPLSRVPGRGDAPDRFEPVFVFRKPGDAARTA